MLETCTSSYCNVGLVLPTATGINATINVNKNYEPADEKQEQAHGDANTVEIEEGVQKKARKDQLDMEKLLRLRNSSFTSDLALLDEALKTLCIDSIPILIGSTFIRWNRCISGILNI